MKRKMASASTISPKVSIPSSVLAILGAVIAGLDLAGIVAVDDSLWIALLGAGGVTFGTGYAASPGSVRSERGYADGGLLLALLLVALIVIVFGAWASHLVWFLLIVVLIVFLLA